jgi:hypothetical protein
MPRPIMAISNTTDNLPSAPPSLANELIEAGELSPPSTLSLLVLQMKEKLKNVPIWPMAVTMVGASLLGFAFMAGTPFSLPLLISGAIFLGLGMAWLMSSQIAKGLGIGMNQENDDDGIGQTTSAQNEAEAANERRESEMPSQISEPNNQARQNREERRSRQTQADEIRRRSAEQREENQRQEDQRRGSNQAQLPYLRFDNQAKKLKAYEERPKANREEDLPRAAQVNAAFDEEYDEDDLEDLYLD